ncbi:sugar phosphate isomerase/epimerase family protein [Rugosimonospora africana]|uniref:Xylose isomerase n=1 Tax=Rugosimonospora africana TaxID=556532 RepID=A0A8J3QTN0_9ACTN|nr:sugar phosphate isomerase/epimerase [Rugosimonospora africana]GIH15932.1 xylose isomerase [Rugosimonospora africana]
MPPGIAAQLWTFHDLAAKDLEGVLTRISELGYLAVEPLGLHGREPAKVRALLDSLGMTLSSAHAPFPAGPDATRILDENAELGATTLVWSLEREEFDSPEAIARGVERINEGAERAAAYGMTIGYHNHFAEFANVFGDWSGSPRGARRAEPDWSNGQSAYDILLDLLDPRVVIELDMYWAQLGGADPAQVIRGLGDRVRFLHVKDGPAQTNEDYMVPVGQGSVDIPAALRASESVRWHIVELDRSRMDMFTALQQSYQYLVGNGLSRGRIPAGSER